MPRARDHFAIVGVEQIRLLVQHAEAVDRHPGFRQTVADGDRVRAIIVLPVAGDIDTPNIP